MGDRANVKVIDRWTDEGKVKKDAVYLYTHWGGAELALTVQRALQRKQRWDDAPYLTRIVFCEMIRGHEADETGFGISGSICDNEHLLVELLVEPKKQEVIFRDMRWEEGFVEGEVRHRWSFSEFIGLSKEEVQAAYLEE